MTLYCGYRVGKGDQPSQLVAIVLECDIGCLCSSFTLLDELPDELGVAHGLMTDGDLEIHKEVAGTEGMLSFLATGFGCALLHYLDDPELELVYLGRDIDAVYRR